MLQHYIEFMYPGSFFAETGEQKVAVRLAPSKFPDRVCGYRFFSRMELYNGEETLVGPKKDYSPWVYFGKSYDLEALAKEAGQDSILYSNIKNNGYSAAVKTKFGSWYPLEDGETVES